MLWSVSVPKVCASKLTAQLMVLLGDGGMGRRHSLGERRKATGDMCSQGIWGYQSLPLDLSLLPGCNEVSSFPPARPHSFCFKPANYGLKFLKNKPK